MCPTREKHMTYSYNDPTVLHAAECARCGRTYRDGDILDGNQRCPDCVEEIEAQIAEEEADDEEPIDAASPIDWFAVAGVITGVGK
jgi:predicted  nucleic acid-binding Zn-ribbon protein